MKKSDRLCYADTSVEIKLGDRILFRHLLGGKTEGIVFYMPGESLPHPEMEFGGIREWAIRLDNGRVISWPYLPGEVKVSKRVKFIERAKGEFKGLQPDDELL